MDHLYLINLPAVRFDTAQVVYRRVDSEGFINYADNRYSVPWRLIGQLIPVRILEDHLEIFNGTIDRVAIRRKENVAFVGESGLGKTHLMQGIARKCCALGYRVRYETSASLIEALNRSILGGLTGGDDAYVGGIRLNMIL